MKKSFDIVFDKLIEENSLKDLEEMFLKLNIKTVYVLREISTKKDLEDDFVIVKSSKVNFKKAYLLKDPSLFHLYKKKELLFVLSKSLKNNYFISTHKQIKFLTDPISENLSFDEQNANSCFTNRINVVFNVNLFRDDFFKNKYLKQALFIIHLLKIHRVNMIFASFAKTKEDLISNDVLNSFLKNFNLEETLINRFLSEDILKIK